MPKQIPVKLVTCTLPLQLLKAIEHQSSSAARWLLTALIVTESGLSCETMNWKSIEN